MDDSEFPLAVWEAAPRRVRYGTATAREILRRTAAGESMRAICRDPTMPAPHTVGRWTQERPEFAANLLAAREAAGGPFRGGRTTYCVATVEAICARVAAGEALIRICADPDMPVAATVYAWRDKHVEFNDALYEAMDVRADRLFEEGWEMAQAATPQTAYVTHVRLAHLRWHVGKLHPKRYGVLKAMPPERDEAVATTPKRMAISVSHFDLGPDGTVFAIPPRDERDERLYLAKFGRPYEGPRGSWDGTFPTPATTSE